MGAKRFHAQKWLLDSVIATVGLDWDQLRMATIVAPAGFEGMGDWGVVAKSVRRFDDISPVMAEAAARREARAQEAAGAGRAVTARESFLIASIYYGVAQWPIDEASARNRELDAKKVECYGRYAERAAHRIERVEIPFGESTLPGWLHLPPGGKAPYPVVIMLPGMDTFKEKLVWAYGDKILERGMAALAIDGPGQYEARLRGVKITPDNFADAGKACIKWIDSRGDLDPARIGLFGRSFGSYAGTVMANAIADRLRGAAVGFPCHEPGLYTLFEEASPTFKNRFMFMAGYEDEDAFDKFARGFDLRGKVGALRCPYLLVAGELDELSPVKHAYDVARRVPGPLELVVYQNERHAPGRAASAQLGPHWYALMADWLAARVVGGQPPERSRFAYIKSSGQVEERPLPEAQP
jgi:dienelactone hydrolase